MIHHGGEVSGSPSSLPRLIAPRRAGGAIRRMPKPKFRCFATAEYISDAAHRKIDIYTDHHAAPRVGASIKGV